MRGKSLEAARVNELAVIGGQACLRMGGPSWERLMMAVYGESCRRAPAHRLSRFPYPPPIESALSRWFSQGAAAG